MSCFKMFQVFLISEQSTCPTTFRGSILTFAQMVLLECVDSPRSPICLAVAQILDFDLKILAKRGIKCTSPAGCHALILGAGALKYLKVQLMMVSYHEHSIIQRQLGPRQPIPRVPTRLESVRWMSMLLEAFLIKSFSLQMV